MPENVSTNPGAGATGERGGGGGGAGGLDLRTRVREIPGVRKADAEALERLGVRVVGQLLGHLPMRHELHLAETSIADLVEDEIVTTRGEITATRRAGVGRKTRFEAVLHDGSGRLDLVWFGATWVARKLSPGVQVRVHGKAKRFGHGLQLANPKFRVIEADGSETGDDEVPAGPPPEEAKVRPVYPASEAIDSDRIWSIVLRVLDGALPLVEDHLPERFCKEKSLPDLASAYRMIHSPRDLAEAREAHRRLVYDELLLFQLAVMLKREHRVLHCKSPALAWSETIDKRIRARFGFELTEAQGEVVRQLAGDLAKPVPTNRLIQGDVGAGKTVVALYAMLLAVASGHQAALMAPTELLAEQHFASISAMLSGSEVRVALLTGSGSAADRAAVEARVASGDVDLVIGTHALVTDRTRFASLAVAVIDEQHRFGVHQRARLRSKGGAGAADPTEPHVIVMTATPIPRTLALTLVGDLDVSTIRTLPPGRSGVITRSLPPERAHEAYQFVRDRVEKGDQAFFVVPAIDTADDEMLDLRTLVERLDRGELAGRRVASVHGRLRRDEREDVMRRFRAGEIDALVATTVIEVGVDVPNAAVMVIEHAERFGLAQLHQLRGRIGRGAKRGVCVLISDATTEQAQQRIAAMLATSDGFELAERDLAIRGPGEVFGLKQSGAPPFKVADLVRDRELLSMARRDASAWVERSPGLAGGDESVLRRRVYKAHGAWLGLGDVG